MIEQEDFILFLMNRFSDCDERQLQHIVYIFQEIGFNFGYNDYRWGRLGPSSGYLYQSIDDIKTYPNYYNNREINLIPTHAGLEEINFVEWIVQNHSKEWVQALVAFIFLNKQYDDGRDLVSLLMRRLPKTKKEHVESVKSFIKENEEWKKFV